MKEALNLVNSNKIYKQILKEIYNKYKKYGKITGSFSLKATSIKEKEILFNFDSQSIVDGKAKIKCSIVKELFNRILKDSTFEELLVKVIGEELKTTKDIKNEEKNEEEKFYLEIVNYAEDGNGKLWFETALLEKSRGYNIIARRYKQEKEYNKLNKLKKDIILVINSLNNLPCLKEEYENIAVFAAINTKDSHFFDMDSYTGKLFIKALAFILNKDEAKEINEFNELYYEAGILKDEISNHTTIYGISGFDKNNKEIPSIKEFNNWNEPLQISISNLLKINYLKVKNNTVYVFENPAVFHKVLKVIGNTTSLICTSGQLNLSSYIIFNKIKNLENIYYAGDFDPEGLMIAYKIKEKYKEKVKFLSYTKENYEKSMSDKVIEEKSMVQLDKINCTELQGIIDVLKINKKPAYQELLIDEYISFINLEAEKLKNL